MGMSGQLKIDQYLTNLATAFPVGNKIGKILAPVVPVEKMSDKIFVDSDDAIAVNVDLAEAVGTSEVDFAAGTPYSFRTMRYGLNAVVQKKQADNAAAVVKLQQRITNKLTNRLLQNHELRVSLILNDTTYVTQTKDVDATAGARWDEASPDLEADIITALSTIYDNTGRIANTLVVPYEAALYLANMDFVRDLLKYQFGMNVMTAEFQKQVMQTVGLPPIIKGLNLVVSSGRVATNAKGLAKTVANPWGKNCLIGYIPPTVPFVDDDFGVITTEYQPFGVYTKPIDDPVGTKVWVDWDYEVTMGNMATWYLLENVIS